MPINEKQGVVYEQPKSAEAREQVASACMVGLKLSMPALLDEMNNQVDAAYAALPTRLYLVDPEGRIAYAGGPGPMGLRPDELEAAIEELLAARPA